MSDVHLNMQSPVRTTAGFEGTNVQAGHSKRLSADPSQRLAAHHIGL